MWESEIQRSKRRGKGVLVDLLWSEQRNISGSVSSQMLVKLLLKFELGKAV